MIYLILLLALILRLVNINQSLWLDEAAQAIESKFSVGHIVTNMTADFHPPLFHIIFHYWMYLGHSEWIMRILTVLLGLGSIFIVYLLTKDIFNRRTAFVAAFLLSINPFHIYFSHELRPYILGCFIGILSIYVFWNALRTNKLYLWIAFFITTTAFLYTSYLAIFLILGQVVFVAVKFKEYRRELSYFGLSLVLSGVLFILWIPVIFDQLRISSGISRDLPGWGDVVSTPIIKALPLTLIKFIIGQIRINPPIMYGIVSVFLVGFWGWLIYRGKSFKDKGWLFVFLLFTFTLVSSVVFSIFLQVVAPKRLIFLLPLLIILISAGINHLKKFYFLTVLIVLSLISFLSLYVYTITPSFQREDWRSAVAKVEQEASNNSAVLFKFSAPFAPYLWYQEKDLVLIGMGDPLMVNESKMDHIVEEKLKGVDKIFIFDYLSGLTDPSDTSSIKLEKAGFIKIDTFDFPGVGLVDYRKKHYD